MKKAKIFRAAATLSAALLLATASMAANKSELTVKVDGLRNDNGEVLVAIVPKSESFTEAPSKSVAADMKKSSKKGVSFDLKDIPDGTYSIYLFHDENGNKKLDEVKRIPQEGFACYKGKQGTPEVTISGKDAKVSVVMVYMTDLIEAKKQKK